MTIYLIYWHGLACWEDEWFFTHEEAAARVGKNNATIYPFKSPNIIKLKDAIA